ncbi:MAG: 4Fe-4S dicluster domain-containing protein [Pseudomonadota bacterium]
MKSKQKFEPKEVFLDAFPATSGNKINGYGEVDKRQATPFFWHPPKRQSHGELQQVVTDYHRQSAAVRKYFSPTPPGGRGPKPVEQADSQVEASAEEWASQIKTCAMDNEADLVGIAAMSDEYVYQGYDIKEPWVIIIGVTMDYEELSQAPPSFENPTAAVSVAKEYNRAARSCRELANFILSQGYFAKAWQGPYASALNMLPAAIAAGMGELGKHGSLINRTYGSSFRLSAVTTDMPLLADAPDTFGADDFCTRCQACVRACPPDAIHNEKQMVRGTQKWYVDFDKCIPYFGEALGCAACIAICPWSRPGNATRLIQRLQKQSDSSAN